MNLIWLVVALRASVACCVCAAAVIFICPEAELRGYAAVARVAWLQLALLIRAGRSIKDIACCKEIAFSAVRSTAIEVRNTAPRA